MIAKFANKSGILVEYNDSRNTMKHVLIINKEINNIFRCDFFYDKERNEPFWPSDKNQIRIAVNFKLKLAGKSVI